MNLRFFFSRHQRITFKRDFDRMFSDGIRRTSGPLLFHLKDNSMSNARLGLSVPKRVGNAVKRNRIKRKCREAFRLSQNQLPFLDILITVRPHETLSTDEYVSLLLKAVNN